MPHYLQFRSDTLENLNEQLAESISHFTEKAIHLSASANSYYITTWHFDVSADCIEHVDISFHIEGGTTQGFVKQSDDSDRYQLTFYTFWPGADCPEEQNITIRKSAKTSIHQIRASEEVSIFQLLHLIRKDLDHSSTRTVLQWAAIHGFKEMNLLHQSQEIIRFLNQPIGSTGDRLFECLLWNERRDVQDVFTSMNSPSFKSWIRNHAAAEHHLPLSSSRSQLVPQRHERLPWIQRPFGVNLFGYASEALGIGEDCRTTAQALEDAGIPVQIIDIPTKHTSKRLRASFMDDPDQVAPYAFSLFTLNAEEHARLVLELGEGICENRYTIGYWPWELTNWPQPWQPLFALADEVWASSKHTHTSMAKALGARKPPVLQQLPLSLIEQQPLTHRQRQFWRQEFNIAQDSVAFICAFDGRSSFWRKNPWAAIKAFQLAFPQDIKGHHQHQSVQLVIKAMHTKIDRDGQRELARVCQTDPRIRLIDSILSREALLGLYGCCDALISLHRAEGYGRVLAEAFLSGLDVIATNYSGPCDFSDGPLFHPVKFRERALLPSHYPHAHGQIWAEPDIAEAAHALEKVASLRSETSSLSRQQLSKIYKDRFSTERIGNLYKQRLEEIWSKRHALEANLRWRTQHGAIKI